MPDYGNPSYWDERYAYEEKIFDWYQDYSTLQQYLEPYCSRNVDDFEILIPGCGNSSLGPSMYANGLVNITNIDISPVVISQMSNRFSNYESMEYAVMDARNMVGIPDDCFDLIVDKGLFDAQLCSQDNMTNVQQLVKEMYRVLKPGGIYFVVSHGTPENRMAYFQRPAPWSVDTFAIVLMESLKMNPKGFTMSMSVLNDFHFINPYEGKHVYEGITGVPVSC